MLKSTIRKGQTVGTVYGPIHFDENGISKDLTAEQEKAIAKVTGYTYEEEKKEEPKKTAPKKTTTSKKTTTKRSPKKEEPKEEPKEEVKEEEKTEE